MKRALFSFIIAITILPNFASAADFEISGWIPYWRSEAGVASILPQLDTFTEVNPFMYTIRTDGSLNQAGPLTDSEWVQLRARAKELNVRFIPTIMSSGPDVIHDTLSDPARRRAHIQAIAGEVYRYGLDGIDIDYEGKYAKTRPYFSQFLKELEEAIGYDKWIMCTIESRTPLDSRYSSPENIPADIEYANDFTEIGKYCDRVRIMAYDQERIDLKLNAERGHPYVPVADVAWVEKTMNLIAQEVPKEKLVLGVPTYGYEWDMFSGINGNENTRYSKLWAFNPGYATEVASKLGLTPTRNAAGELQLLYPASQSPDPVIPIPSATRVMTWSDSVAIQQKVDLAKRLGLAGVALFKIDGGQDPNTYAMLTPHKVAHTSVVPPISSSGSVAGVSTADSGTSAIAIPTRDLETGATGEDVRMLQKYLNSIGFTVAASGAGSPGNETAKFGALTRAAVVKFQKAHSITPAVGYYGPITRAKMSTLAAR